MKRTFDKLRPAEGFSKMFYWALVIVLPLLVFMFIKVSVLPLAYAVVLISKWRMFAIRPRHWLASIRLNAVDLIVGLSFVVFMIQASSLFSQLVWIILYELWLIFIKSKSSVFWISVQAGISQFMGLTAVYMIGGRFSLLSLVILTSLISYLSVRHFFSGFDDSQAVMMSRVWSYMSASIAWVLGHWLLYYGPISQPVLILSVLFFGLGTLYYLDKSDRLSALAQREVIVLMSIVLLVIVVFSSWGNKAL